MFESGLPKLIHIFRATCALHLLFLHWHWSWLTGLLEHLAKTSVTLGLFKLSVHGKRNTMHLRRTEMNISYPHWTTQGSFIWEWFQADSLWSVIHREQLFFISFARIWAREMKPAAAVSSGHPTHVLPADNFPRFNAFGQTLTLQTDSESMAPSATCLNSLVPSSVRSTQR